DIQRNSYDLGIELKRIYDEELWKARGHKTWKEFVEKELEIGRSMAYRLVETVSKFDRETFTKVGSTKLSLIAQIDDDEQRETALEEARQGASVRDVTRTTRSATGKGAPAKSSDGKASAPPKKAGEITLLA